MFSVVNSNVYSDTHEMNTHIHTSNDYTHSFCRHMNRNKSNAYSHSLNTHDSEMHIHTYTQCFLRTGCDFVSTRVCILVVFFRWYHIHSVFGGLWQTHHASLRSTLSFAPRVLIFVHIWTSHVTLCLALHSHCATFSLAPCYVPCSHRVVKICVPPA